MITSYLFFPATVGLACLLLIGKQYRKPGRIEEVFSACRRDDALRSMVLTVLVLLPLVFCAIVLCRFVWMTEGVRDFVRLPHAGPEWKAWLMFGVLGCALTCEGLLLAHLFGNLIYAWWSATRYALPETAALPNKAPRVAVLIPCCDEQPHVLERSLASASRFDYPDFRVLLLENSRDLNLKKQAHTLAARYKVEAVDIPNRGHKAGVLNDADPLLDEETEYIAVLDADQKVESGFLSDLVSILERNKRLAFVQTPQLYVDSETSLLVRAACQQLMLLYDSVLEGKSTYEKAPCYGTNFVMRRAALKDVGGWDETTATEDLATSYHLHRKGWRSVYVRKLYATGMAPPNLSSYWGQQRRWAWGNAAIVRKVLGQLFQRSKGEVPFMLAIDYIWSASFYLATVALSVVATWPTILLIVDLLTNGNLLGIVRTGGTFHLSGIGWAYLSIYPLYVIMVFFPYLNMRLRGYPLRNLALVQGLVPITAPIVLMPVFHGLFRRKRVSYKSTPKTAGSDRSSLLAPQSLLFIVFLLTGSVIGHYALSDPRNFVAWILLLWALVHTTSLSHFFVYLFEGRGISTDSYVSDHSTR